MKKLFCFIFFLSILNSHSAFADNWELFPFNQSSYYSDDGSTDFNHLYHYTQDSLRDDGGAKTFFLNRFPYSYNHDQCIYESCKLLGDSTEFDSLSSNNGFYYFILGNDTASIFQFAHSGDYWFISCPNGSQGFDSIKVSCTFENLTTVIGQTDSVKRFLIEAWNNGTATNYFNNYEFELSKTFGLIKWFSFKYLLHENTLSNAKQYSLVGCEVNGSKFGYALPTFEDYFSGYQPGNIFKFRQPHFPYDDYYTRDSIITAIHTSDSILIYCKERFVFVNSYGNYSDVKWNNQTISFVTKTFYKKSYENTFNKTDSQIIFHNDGHGYYLNFIYDDILGFTIYERKLDFMSGTGCIPNDGPYGTVYLYSLGLGCTGETHYYSGPSSSYFIVGYTLNGIEYGDSYWKFSDDTIAVITPICNEYLYSNLVEDKLTTCLNSIQRYNIFDMEGRLLLSGYANYSEVDVSKLVTGFYIFEFEHGLKTYHHKFFKY